MPKLQNLSQLKAAGGFVPREPLKREVTWTHVADDGEEIEYTCDIYIARRNLGSVLDAQNAPEGVDKIRYELSKSLMFANEKGEPELISYETAVDLEPTLAMEIFKVIREARTPKNLQPPTSSSAISSPVESAATP